jgi:hypothetical protein
MWLVFYGGGVVLQRALIQIEINRVKAVFQLMRIPPSHNKLFTTIIQQKIAAL